MNPMFMQVLLWEHDERTRNSRIVRQRGSRRSSLEIMSDVRRRERARDYAA